MKEKRTVVDWRGGVFCYVYVTSLTCWEFAISADFRQVLVGTRHVTSSRRACGQSPRRSARAGREYSREAAFIDRRRGERARRIISCGRTTNFFGNPARTVAFMEGVSGFSEDRGFQFLSSMETGGFVLSF